MWCAAKSSFFFYKNEMFTRKSAFPGPLMAKPLAFNELRNPIRADLAIRHMDMPLPSLTNRSRFPWTGRYAAPTPTMLAAVLAIIVWCRPQFERS